MKSRLLKYFNLNALLLTCYLLFVWVAYLFVYITKQKLELLILTLFGGVLLYFFTTHLLRWIGGIDFNASFKEKNITQRRIVFIASTLFSLAVMLVWFVAYFPGAFSPDSLGQYGQALNGYYNDWHPVWHTLVFFTLPLKLTGKVSAIVGFQMIYFSLVIGYMSMIIYKNFKLKYAILGMAYILLNPYTGHILLYPWKDVGFAIASLLSICMLAEIYFSKGRWADKTWKCAIVGVALANATLFRHNGILFTFFAMVALVFLLNKKQCLKVVLGFVIFLILVKGLLYQELGVGKASNRISESVGLPLTIMGALAKENPEALDQEMAEFVYAIATPEEWQEKYTTGNFNSIKWSGANLDNVNNSTFPHILKLTAKCFLRAPGTSLKAFFTLTDMVYGVDNGVEGDVGAGITGNDYGIAFRGNERLVSFLGKYKTLMTQTIFKYGRSLGMSMVIVLVALLAKCNLKTRKGWKKVFICLPMFTYNFGTMLLLTGYDSRFFYVSFLVCPILTCIALDKKIDKEEEATNE